MSAEWWWIVGGAAVAGVGVGVWIGYAWAAVEGRRRERIERELRRAEVEAAKEALGNAAGRALAERSEALKAGNREQWADLLGPLKDKMEEFRRTVAESRDQEVRSRAELREAVRGVMGEAARLGGEARDLARALRGGQKTQGLYGEMVLEDALVRSGLKKGVHFFCQTAMRDGAGEALAGERGGRLLPDVTVRYPSGEELVVDSKVSLTAYLEAVNAESAEARAEAVKRHVASVRRHVRELAAKDYPGRGRAAGREMADFSLMFVPNDGALGEATAADPGLWEEAFAQRVVLVSPLSLMTVLRVVRLAWTKEEQSENCEAIVKAGAELLERARDFVATMEDVGRGLGTAVEAWRHGMGVLRGGKGARSIAASAERLAALGVEEERSAAKRQKKKAPALLEGGESFGQDLQD